MKYDHMVKVNGIYYLAGTDVPNDKNETVVEEIFPPYSDEDIVLETKENNPKQYTKTEINRMTTAELKDLATYIGISDADNKTGGELKKSLIEYYKL